MTDILVTARSLPSDDVTVKVRGVAIGGWTRVRITAGIETVPRVFEVGMTAYPGVVAQAGDPCEVRIGRNTVITGIIDRDVNRGDADSHELTLIGRGLCRAVVDCSAEWEGGQISSLENPLTTPQIATKLLEPYGLSVITLPGADPGPTIPQFNLTNGETAWSIIERLARVSKLLCYEDEAGNLVFAQASKEKAASGVAYGQNVLAWEATNSVDQRYSEYTVCALQVDLYGDVAGNSSGYIHTAKDENVPLHRKLYLVADTAIDNYAIPIARAEWELNRRIGRASAVTATVDSWRDAGGALWTPNTLVQVDVPGLRLADNTLLLAEVSYLYGEGGKVAELVLMPSAAFAIEPILFQPAPPDALPAPLNV